MLVGGCLTTNLTLKYLASDGRWDISKFWQQMLEWGNDLLSSALVMVIALGGDQDTAYIDQQSVFDLDCGQLLSLE